MYGTTIQCNSKTYYRIFHLSATVPNLMSHLKSSLINHLTNDRLLNACLNLSISRTKKCRKVTGWALSKVSPLSHSRDKVA